ncbi:hypothetical protein ABBQ32_011654 [Trebouxia sp. C0010 RCD-2024]
MMRSQQVHAAESSDGRVVSILYKDGLFHDKPAVHKRLWAKVPMKAFLPEGYPGSVTADYASFQLWDSIQAVCSYVRGILSSQAMLTGVGVGQQAATPLSAVFQFFLRDLSGMLGGVTFAFFQGSKLDVYAKQWRLFADCLNNVGLVMELASPVFPSLFLTLACLGSIARAITGVAAGSTRAALTLHFAKQNNAADVSAKEGTQETATSLGGMLLGMAFTHAFNDVPWLIWVSFLSLTALHVYANIQAVRALTLTSLNPSRLQLLVDTFYHKVSLGEVNVAQLCECAADQLYMLAPCRGCIHVVLATSCTPADVLMAFVHARVLALMLTQDGGSDQRQPASVRAKHWKEQHWQDLNQQIQKAGWDSRRVNLAQSGCTAAWGQHLRTHEE